MCPLLGQPVQTPLADHPVRSDCLGSDSPLQMIIRFQFSSGPPGSIRLSWQRFSTPIDHLSDSNSQLFSALTSILSFPQLFSAFSALKVTSYVPNFGVQHIENQWLMVFTIEMNYGNAKARFHTKMIFIESVVVDCEVNR